MRRLIADDRGAVAVLVAVVLTALLGASALAIDMGAMYVERRELQNGADAAALAIAEDCANGICDETTRETTAKTYVDANARDGKAHPESFVADTTARRITVVNRTLTLDDADGLAPMFARIFGLEKLPPVRARATAGWWGAGFPGNMGPAPIAASLCEFMDDPLLGDTFTLDDVKARALALPSISELPTSGGVITAGLEIPLHTVDSADTCTIKPGFSANSDGDIMQAGFGFLKLDDGDPCQLDITGEVPDTGEFWVPAISGNYPQGVDCLILQYLNAPTIPIFTGFENNKTIPQLSPYSTGNGDEYRLYGPAGFYITGISIPGAKLGHKCAAASSWCIRGHFVEKTDASATEGESPINMGVSSVGLVN